MTLALDASPCDDGNACTKSETCLGGVCKAGVNANTCQCQKDAECTANEDATLCNGTLYCDKAAGVCVVNPATVVTCSTAFDTDCEAAVCQLLTGKCALAPVHQGNICGDGGVCSGGGWCALGSCVTENKQVCECTNDGDCAAFEDGDLCNGVTYCDLKSPKPLCKLNPATVVLCPSVGDSACQKNLCQPATGKCASQAVAGTCSDGMACTANDSCLSGKCVGNGINCVDALPCTDDTCKEPFGCLHLPAAATPCDDGNACTLKDACVGGQCVGVKALCDDGKGCTDDACATQSGCVHLANSAPCSDGDACTVGDGCAAGGCQAGLAVDCSDGNPCTSDACAKATGICSNLAKANACSDGNVCTDDSCDGKLGCTYVANVSGCTDGNQCTQGDTCAQTVCQPKTVTVCNDGLGCTDDSCDPKGGCVFAPNAAPCDDGSVCSIKDVCKAGLCQAAAPLACDDGNDCTDDSCQAKTGCQYANNTKSCDGTACTGGSVCSAGKCFVGTKVLLSATKLDTGSDDYELTGVAAYPDGGLFITGSGIPGTSVWLTAYAARLGSDGVPVWKQAIAPYGGTRLFAAHVLPDGTAAGFGATNVNNGQSGAMRWSADGVALPTVYYPACQAEMAAVKHPLGGYWTTGINSSFYLSVKRIDANLELEAAAIFTGNTTGTGIVATAVSGALVVGTSTSAKTAGGMDGYVLVLDSKLSLVSESFLGGTLDDTFAGMVRSAPGVAVAVGSRTLSSSGQTDGWVVALDDKGTVLWQRTYGGALDDSFSALAALPDGGFLLVGSTFSSGAGSKDAWLVRTDKWGNVHWQRTLGTGGSESLSAVTLRPDYGFAAVGAFNVKDWVLRADAWGNTSCSSGSACLDIGFTGCDDQNPCTMDTCNPLAGCEHAPFATGTRCAAANGCDVAGKCLGPIAQ